MLFRSRSSPRLTSIKSVMPFSHLILCRPLLLLPPIPPSISQGARKFHRLLGGKTSREMLQMQVTGPRALKCLKEPSAPAGISLSLSPLSGCLYPWLVVPLCILLKAHHSSCCFCHHISSACGRLSQSPTYKDTCDRILFQILISDRKSVV